MIDDGWAPCTASGCCASGSAYDSAEIGAHLLDDLARRSRRLENSELSRATGSSAGRSPRWSENPEQRRARSARGADHPQGAGRDVRRHHQRRREDQLDPPAEQVSHRRTVPRYGTCSISMPAIWPNNARRRDATPPGPDGAERPLRRDCLGVGDQLGGSAAGTTGIHHQDVGRRRRRRYWRKFARHLERRACPPASVRSHCVGRSAAYGRRRYALPGGADKPRSARGGNRNDRLAPHRLRCAGDTRPRISVAPPGGHGTMMRAWPPGKFCARARDAARSSGSAIGIMRREISLNSPPAPDKARPAARPARRPRGRARRARRQDRRALQRAVADRHQRADHRAHLVVQERARRRRRCWTSSPSRVTSSRSSVLTGDLRLALGGAEGGEVVLADQPLRGRVHRLGVERPRHPPGAAALERQAGAAVDDAVEIVPLHRREARVEIVRHALGREDRDRMRPQMRVERVAHGVGRASPSPDRHARPGRARARRRRCGRRRCTVTRLAAERLDRRRSARPAPTAPLSWHLPAGERRAVIFDGELVARHRLSRAPCPAQRRAAQEFLGLHRPARRRAAARGGAPRPRRRRPSADRRAPCRARRRPRRRVERSTLTRAGLAGQLEPGAGKRRQAADLVVHLPARLAPSRCASRPCRSCRVGDAVLRLRRELQRAALERAERAHHQVGAERAPARRAVRRPSCRAPIGDALGQRDGPVSRPSSICMTMTPVSASPAMIARWIGAAPRQRGSSEACTLKQPSGTRLEDRLRQDQAIGDDHRGIGADARGRPPAASAVFSDAGVSTGKAEARAPRARPATAAAPGRGPAGFGARV